MEKLTPAWKNRYSHSLVLVPSFPLSRCLGAVSSSEEADEPTHEPVIEVELGLMRR